MYDDFKLKVKAHYEKRLFDRVTIDLSDYQLGKIKVTA